MKKICFLIAATLISAATFAQTAKSVLDKAAANITVKSGVQVKFKVTGSMGNTSVWFDGKTQWTYMKNNDEVNVTTPTESQLQAINPYNFINLYKNGYDATLNSSGKDYVVHLTASTKDKKIRELFITVNKSSNTPTQVKLLQGTKWTIFDISDLKKQSVPDSQFRFNAKDFPQAEIIDLR